MGCRWAVGGLSVGCRRAVGGYRLGAPPLTVWAPPVPWENTMFSVFCDVWAPPPQRVPSSVFLTPTGCR